MTYQLPPTDHPVWMDYPTRPFQLVLQGGGLRGMFTCGVLDFFLDHGLLAESVVGVSMGTVCAYSYVAGEPGQTIKMAIKYRDDPRFMSLRNWLRTGTYVGSHFIFDTIPNEIEHLPKEWFTDSPMTLTTVATDVDTGRPDYQVLRKGGGLERQTLYVEASTALPYVSRMVRVDGKRLLDGGICESIPYAYDLDRYRGREVVVLTRERGYVREAKHERASRNLSRLRYGRTPQLRQRLDERVPEYNRELREVERLHDAGDLFAIWPDRPIDVGVYEKDMDVLLVAYEQGLAAAAERWDDLLAYLGIEA